MPTMYQVGSVTNAMRGKQLLEKQGIRAYVRRHVEPDGKNGCGYSLYVPHRSPDAVAILTDGGVTILNGNGRDVP